MSHMPPPDQHIGVVQDFGRQPLIGIVKRSERHLNFRVFGQELTDSGMQAVGVQLACLLIGLFVTELVPYGYSDFVFHGVLLM